MVLSFSFRIGDIETSPDAFGNKWKVEPSCPDSNPGGDPPPHPCDLASQLRSKAEDECGILLRGMTGI